jgi:site-specific DNA-methyltransferase (adenine-specific)
VGKRESHDSTEFYGRFVAPEVTTDDAVSPVDLGRDGRGLLLCGDARHMSELKDGSVALVVTSPPYFAGKEYEADLSRGDVPASYLEYLALLRDVFAECARVLEPGGRIAVNVANLGRRPYRSLSADVIGMLQDELGLLLRGEIVWVKAEGASGSCAWGSFASPANPVLRDVSERIVVASRGRFDRARAAARRRAEGLPADATITNDEFLEATLDVWRIPPESARRVGHPAPFPVELPRRLIELYTYRGDVVLDPFLGSGSTAVAAVRSGRRYAGYDTDPHYVELARRRLAAAAADARADAGAEAGTADRDSRDAAARREGASAAAIAAAALETAGFRLAGRKWRVRSAGLAVDLVATDADGRPWYFDVAGGFTSGRRGLEHSDAVWRVLGRASVLAARGLGPYVVLTTAGPVGEGRRALEAAQATQTSVFDVVELFDPAGAGRLARYASGVGAETYL